MEEEKRKGEKEESRERDEEKMETDEPEGDDAPTPVEVKIANIKHGGALSIGLYPAYKIYISQT